MNNLKKLLANFLVLGTLLVSCTKDFKEVNTDPNRIDQISPGTLLNPIIYEVASFNMQQADNITFDLMQVMLNFPSPSGGIHRYDLTENTGSSTWNAYYRWLKNIKEMYDASVKAQDPNYQAIAMTLNAWVFSNLTDCFGDVPMTEALRGDEQLFYPKFDKQEEIYPRLLSDLDSANRLFVTTRAMVYGTEILFANNVTKWKKFCNSLHLRLLLRLSKIANLDVYTKIRAMVSNPTQYPIFTSNAEAAVLNLTGITPLVSPWGRPIDFPTFRAAGKFFLDSLNAMNDPRRAKFASQARSITPPNPTIGYLGIPSGYTGSESQFNYTPSNLLQALVTAPMIVPILPYAEVEFIKAELEWQSGNAAAAKTAYEKGVKAAIEQWGLTMPTDYFTDADAAYNGTLARIMLQKYYALFFVDYQQWFEYRRTGHPVLPVGPGMLNNGVMPSRFEYPLSVRISNPDNYEEAASWMGGDDINSKVWWER
ncbi:MAG TPA: SusD/RagB family nutrient-binding outer membrane lipoprotein [Chitinophagaceae bacterium]|nr:SusD/RagB family nutrient-binding outer membrane lipoprotein [Chitinophagaceae bacterium]